MEAKQYTTIRITRTLKDKLNNIATKNETYSDVLEKVIEESLTIKAVERKILNAVRTKQYEDLDDIEW